ncbi:MAG: TDP-N-acetylfucosamine:lipid II N-acetylfucosaminyltransferase [Chitinophagales bacterium]|nr:TDP-N-acetylfucosamine:lipid II N-acetylfucosaminyltransferase [Chitinophagales bacterium]
MPDDKYVETYIEMAERASNAGENVYLIRDKEPYKYLSEKFPLINAPVGSAVFNEYTAKMGNGDRILLHFLHPSVIKWLANFTTSAKIGWAYWGADFYEHTYIDYNNYDRLTQAFLDSKVDNHLSRFYLLSKYRVWKRNRKEKESRRQANQVAAKALAKIDYIFHFMKGDYDLIKQYFPSIKAKFEYFHYSQPFSFDDIEADVQEKDITISNFSKHIWISNCGYPTGNHLDVFQLLKDIDDDTGICLPLSYGDKEYTAHIIKEGKRLFGERLIPFTEYMDFSTFVRILKQMDVAIMGHNSPWAMGNILILFYFGRRVFVKERLPSYQWMKNHGACIERYEDFDVNTCFEPLSAECINRNKEYSNILSRENSFETISKMLKI